MSALAAHAAPCPRPGNRKLGPLGDHRGHLRSVVVLVLQLPGAGDAYAEQGPERVHGTTMLATMVRRRAG